jgi:hypothetical protein
MEGEAADDGDVFGGVAAADTALIFIGANLFAEVEIFLGKH